MFAAAWSSFAGACMDEDERKVRDAATARPRWACYRGDTERALLAGWMGHVPFDVVDIDAYGSPWPFAFAWCRSGRLRAPVTHLFLTDGYMDHADIAPRCRALFADDRGKRGDMPAGYYLEHARGTMRRWAALAGGVVEEFGTAQGAARKVGTKRMRLHYLRLGYPASSET